MGGTRPSDAALNRTNRQRLDALSRRYPGKLELRAPNGATPIHLRMQAQAASRLDHIEARVTFMSKPRASVYLRSTASLSTHDQKYLRDFHQTRPSVTMGRSNVLPRKSLQRQLRKAARNTVSRWCVSTREFITR